MVFFLAVMSVFAVATVSAATTDLADIGVEVDGQWVSSGSNVAVTAGETIDVKVFLDPLVDAEDVKVKVELQGTKDDVSETTAPFVVEAGTRAYKTLRIQVPYELQDEVSDDLELNVKVWNGDYESEHSEITLRVMRPLYNADIMSIESSSTVEAGENYAVNVVLKNIGYADLDDLYVTLRIPALNVERSAYFGDLVALETCDDGCEDDDSVRGTFYLAIPYDAEAGVYTLEATAENDDLELSEAKQILVSNEIPNSIITTTDLKKVGVGQKTQFDLVLVNPTNKVKAYTVVTENSEHLATSASDVIVVIPAGSSKTINVFAEADKEGLYDFDVTFLTGDSVAETQELTLDANGSSFGSTSTNPVVILTIVLAIILLVLLVVLIVMLGKRSNKQDDFSESYY